MLPFQSYQMISCRPICCEKLAGKVKVVFLIIFYFATCPPPKSGIQIFHEKGHVGVATLPSIVRTSGRTPFLVGRGLRFTYNTPPKTNVKAENHMFEKEKHIPNLHDQWFHASWGARGPFILGTGHRSSHPNCCVWPCSDISCWKWMIIYCVPLCVPKMHVFWLFDVFVWGDLQWQWKL